MSEKERFHITAWPDAPVEIPETVRYTDLELGSDGWLYVHGPRDFVRIPDELYLRERLELTLEPDDVVDFMREYGAILDPGEIMRRPFETKTSRPRFAAGHVDDATSLLGIAQVLVRHWLAHERGEKVMRVWEQAGVASVVRSTAVDEELAWGYFATELNRGLEWYHARVHVTYRMFDTDVEQGAPEPGLYSTLCLQLLNHITEALPARQCANETCERPFVRQIGGVQHGQYRTTGNLKYCSPQCAKAQAMRELRRRKRKGK